MVSTVDSTHLLTDNISESSGSTIYNGQPSVSLAGKTWEDIERQAIQDTLRACRGNKAKSARMLGISEKSIYNKMRRLGLPLANAW
jgi:DNA-binding NtrC family response regulator